jgi:hypothetical protein
MGSVRTIGIYTAGPGRPLKLIARLRLVAALVLAVAAAAMAVAGTGCGDAEENSAPPAPADEPVPRLTVRVAALETRITEYCETRSSGAASAADDDRAADDVGELIRIARRDPGASIGGGTERTVGDALAGVATVLRSDCRDSPLQRPVERALDAFP